MSSVDRHVVIVGGGISGLSTAFYLQQQGIRSTILESSGRLGGLIRTDRIAGCDLEAGPDSFISTKPAVARLAQELGITHQLLGSNDVARRIFVVRKGQLTAMPRGMVMMVPSHWQSVLCSPLFSFSTKLRFLREYFSPPRRRLHDFSIRELVLDHFGEEALQYLTEPLLAGVYGGNAAALSARSVLPRFVDYEVTYGSLIKGVQKAEPDAGLPGAGKPSLFLSFQAGMQTLTDAVANSLGTAVKVIFEPAHSIRPNGSGWELQLASGPLQASHVVLACAAHSSADLLSNASPALSQLLAAIPHSSSVLVTLLFDRSHFPHALEGFGFLVPPPERKTIAAATWINTKFPSRVAPDIVAIRSFLVDPEADQHARTSDSDLIQLVLDDLQRLMRVRVKSIASKVDRWPNSMPQYVVGHSARIVGIHEHLTQLRGLYLASNYIDGVGIPDCIRNANSVALRIAK